MRTYLTLGPFTGIVASLDPESIPPSAAADMLNVRVENGVIKRRYGTRLFAAAASDWGTHGAVYGFDYVQGYTNAYALVEEYLAFENHSNTDSGNNVLPFSINASGTRAALGSSPSAIPQPTYGNQPGIKSFAFGGVSYSISPADGLYKHTIGTLSSWTKLQPPAAPTQALGIYLFTTPLDTGAGLLLPWDTSSGASGTFKWSGLNPATDIVYQNFFTSTGAKVNSDGSLSVGANYSYESQSGSSYVNFVEIDLTKTTAAGGSPVDWRAYNTFQFDITCNLGWFEAFGVKVPDTTNLPSVSVLFESNTTNNATPTLTFKNFSTDLSSPYGVIGPDGVRGTAKCTVVCTFSSQNSTDWSQMKKLKITAEFIGHSGQSLINTAGVTFSPLRLSSAVLSGSVVVTGSHLTFDGTVNGGLQFTHDATGSATDPQTESWVDTLDGTNGPGQQDWTYNDRIVIPIDSDSVVMDGGAFSVTLTNAAGATFPTTALQVLGTVGSSDQNSVAASSTHCMLVCDWMPKLGRSDFQHIQKITVGWSVIGGSGKAGQKITVGQIKVGEVDCTAYDDSNSPVNLQLAYTHYSSSTGLESAVAGTLSLTPTQAKGYQVTDPLTGSKVPLFARPKLYIDLASTTGRGTLYDNYRLYGKRPSDSAWALIATVALAATGSGGSGKTFGGVTYDASYSLRSTWSEDQAGGLFNPGGAQWGNVVCGAAFEGWVVWGSKGGYQNIQHSRIGFPETVYANSDLTQLSPDFTDRPATFTLADNQADDPVAMFGCGSNLVILGSNGVYAQSGQSPSSMTPPTRVPKALGTWGQYACCKWHTDQGIATVVYASRYLEGIWMVVPTYTFFGTLFEVQELTKDIRGLMKSFLYDGGGFSSWADLRLSVDEELDSLWVTMGNRAMVLRRPSLVDGQRHWELYAYSVGGGVWKFVSQTTARRFKYFDSQGKVYDVEWSSAASAYIDAASSDSLDATGTNGVPISSLYWTSKKFSEDQVTRVNYARVQRDGMGSENGTTVIAPSLSCVSTRQTATNVLASGKYNTRFGALQQGHEHQYKIILDDTSAGGVKKVSIEHFGPLGRRVNE